MSDDERYSLDEIKAAFLKAFNHMAENEDEYSLEQLVKALHGEPFDDEDDGG